MFLAVGASTYASMQLCVLPLFLRRYDDYRLCVRARFWILEVIPSRGRNLAASPGEGISYSKRMWTLIVRAEGQQCAVGALVAVEVDAETAVSVYNHSRHFRPVAAGPGGGVFHPGQVASLARRFLWRVPPEGAATYQQ